MPIDGILNAARVDTGLDSTRLVPYRTVPYRTRTVGGPWGTHESRETRLSHGVLCARNNSRSVPRLVIYVGMGRCVRCCGTERWTTPGWNWRSEKGPVLVLCFFSVFTGKGRGGLAPLLLLASFCIKPLNLLCGSPEPGCGH